MTDIIPPQDPQIISNEDEDEIDKTLIKKLINKKEIRLLFPYADRLEMKKLGARWNAVKKIWYYPSLDGNQIPPELIPFKCNDIHIEYEDKEYWKSVLPSMRWDDLRKRWIVNERDYRIFCNL
tara:strand:- start:1813 stop:2181 length:369 start_codon:yes stop_codon:yes gene_type:complete